MKKVKIKFICLGGKNANGFFLDPEHNILTDILKEEFEVFFSERPDFVIYSDYEYPSRIFQYDCVRIHWQQEYIVPDFNVCDYAVGSNHMEFGERYFRLLPYTYYLTKDVIDKAKRRVEFTEEDLKRKKYFCAFVHANPIAPERNRMEEILSRYKTVSSGGRYKNNIGFYVKNKRKFFSQCKFALVFENTYGYDSDRLVDAFASGTIPIYWGDPQITKEFNSKAFINVHEYRTFEEAVEKIKELDQDDGKYMEMMREPIFAAGFSIEQYYHDLKEFLVHIFSQEPEKAFRRNRTYWGVVAERTAASGARIRSVRVFANRLADIFCSFFKLKRLGRFLNKIIFFYGQG